MIWRLYFFFEISEDWYDINETKRVIQQSLEKHQPHPPTNQKKQKRERGTFWPRAKADMMTWSAEKGKDGSTALTQATNLDLEAL